MKLKNTLKAFGLGIILTAVLGIGIANPIKVYAADEVAIDETNFPDSVFRSYVETNFDTDGNGVLSSEEINAVTSIENSTEKYSSLQGIEYFTKLTSLVCSDNKLTKLETLVYDGKKVKVTKSKNSKCVLMGSIAG
jgi:Leucine-rich repeat (LRR) protein